MPVDLGSLKLFMGPSALGGPDDLEAAVLAFIDGARVELCIAVQELESESITRAIVNARLRGLLVRVIIESDYLQSNHAVANPFEPGGTNEENRRLHTALLRARVPVTSDLNPKIFHQKFMVRDVRGPRAAVLTGSTNFTPTGTGANLNHVLTVAGKRVAGIFQEEFEELWTGTYGTKRERHDPKPRAYQVSGVRVKTLFAPEHSPEMEIMKQMLKARERIDFAIFTFAQSSGIDDTMIAVQRAGISVRGVLDRGQGNQRWAATRGLVDAGCTIHLNRQTTGLGKLHHKLMVIDRQLVVTGSFNYTEPATLLNDENIVIVGDLGSTNARTRERQGRVAEFALAEIDRIVAEHAGPVLSP